MLRLMPSLGSNRVSIYYMHNISHDQRKVSLMANSYERILQEIISRIDI
mgnify:FL=1